MDIQSFVLHCRYPFPMSISAIELTEGLYIRIIIALYHLQFLSSTVYSRHCREILTFSLHRALHRYWFNVVTNFLKQCY